MVTATGILKSYNNAEIFLLKKKHPADNLSKDLIVSGYTLESIPSMQRCKAENLVVYSKSMQTLYFAIHSVVQFRADMSNNMDIALTNDIDDVSISRQFSTEDAEVSATED